MFEIERSREGKKAGGTNLDLWTDCYIQFILSRKSAAIYNNKRLVWYLGEGDEGLLEFTKQLEGAGGSSITCFTIWQNETSRNLLVNRRQILNLRNEIEEFDVTLQNAATSLPKKGSLLVRDQGVILTWLESKREALKAQAQILTSECELQVSMWILFHIVTISTVPI